LEFDDERRAAVAALFQMVTGFGSQSGGALSPRVSGRSSSGGDAATVAESPGGSASPNDCPGGAAAATRERENDALAGDAFTAVDDAPRCSSGGESQELLLPEMLAEITGLDLTGAMVLLEASGGDLSAAVTLHLENQQVIRLRAVDTSLAPLTPPLPRRRASCGAPRRGERTSAG